MATMTADARLMKIRTSLRMLKPGQRVKRVSAMPCSNWPVICLARLSSGDGTADAGFTDHLTKSVDLSTLERALNSAHGDDGHPS